VHRHCAEEAQITSLASQIGRHREKVNIVHQRHQDGGGTFLLSLEPHHQGQTHQYQQPGKGVFDPHQIRGKAAVGVDGRELRKVHEVQHQPVEEDQSALEQKLMPPAYAGELLQGLGRPAPTQFFCDRWQLHLPVCLLFFVKPACEVQGGHVLERQFHRHSGGRGLIHGKDHLQRPAAGLSVDIRGPVMDDGVHHIRVNGGMAVAVDIAGGLLKPLQGCVLLPLVGKLPDVDVIGGGTADLHRSRLT
ncbi:D-alanyl-D-alanine carboxypeptidase, partial [Dysosmobacter welbionis]